MGNYLAHTQGKRHQQNLARRAFKDARDAPILPAPSKYVEKRHAIKIGRPGYKVTKSRDASSGQRALLFEVDYPEADSTVEPYETIGFKVPNDAVDKGEDRFFTNW